MLKNNFWKKGWLNDNEILNIKATTTVSKYAEKIGIDRVQLTKILHGKTKNPNIVTINKILDGLDLGYELKYEIKLQPKSA